MNNNNYSYLVQALHHLVLGNRFIPELLHDIEKFIYKKKIKDISKNQHIFINGLARSGSTILMRSIFETGEFSALTYRDMPFIISPNIWNKISKKFKKGKAIERQHGDNILIDLDGSENKANLGANATLAVSLANSKCAALSNKKSLFKNLGNNFSLPFPLMNIINGGAHADNDLNIQEFMIRPDSAKNFMDAIEKCFIVIQNLKKLLKSNKMLTNVGDEGGFAPSINTNEQALELIVNAIEKSKLKPGKDIVICLDVAANELINGKGEYSIQSKNFSSADANIDYYKKLISNYPIKSIEDPFAEEDWESWKKVTNEIGKNVQIVGDDLFVTNVKRLSKGIKEKSATSILVKPNQIGTLTETLEVISMAKSAGFNTIISHRSGDTEDTFIADLASATMSSQIKTGSLARSERVAKYNRLLRIEEELGKQVKMAKI